MFPVLVEGAVLPRKEELPEKLSPILNYNAITISDRNWDSDILGLGKIISFDLPTTNEKILFRIQVIIYALLSASLIFSSAIVSLNAVELVDTDNTEITALISLPLSAIPFYVIVCSLIVLALILNMVAREKQKYIIYDITSGAVISAFFFFGIIYIKNDYHPMIESMFVIFGPVLASTFMFTFLGLSGFKPK